MSRSYGGNGATFHCIQMTRDTKDGWRKNIESPKERKERIDKVRKRKEKRRA